MITSRARSHRFDCPAKLSRDGGGSRGYEAEARAVTEVMILATSARVRLRVARKTLKGPACHTAWAAAVSDSFSNHKTEVGPKPLVAPVVRTAQRSKHLQPLWR